MSDFEAVGSLIWGEKRAGSQPFRTLSPVDGSELAAGRLLEEFDDLLSSVLPKTLDFGAIGVALVRGISRQKAEFSDSLHRETGFVPSDCRELVEGALAYAQGYADHPSTQLTPPPASEFASGGRRIALTAVPFGTVAAILPQNAFLPLALACMLNALRAGNRVILRSPTQSARSAALLSEVVSQIPELVPFVSILLCPARSFVDAFMASTGSGLLQFFGSSRRAGELTSRGFDSGKTVLVDGEGNTWVYVDSSFPVETAAEILVQGAFRYRGQTCTSINGAILHPELFEAVSRRVAALAADRARGPLFDEAQAEWCLGRVTASGGKVVAGGIRQGALLSPSVVVHPAWDSELVREGIFGPALWLAPGDADTFADRWLTNRYPLSAAVLQSPADPGFWVQSLPGLARLVLNGDPSIEDPFEYWGGYAPSGQNPVSAWPAKYQRVVQIDSSLTP